MQLYHCHATPLKKHIHKGLYGAFIIDPKEPRPPAQELVMVMNGFDTDGDGENNFYTVNGRTFYYARYPIRVKRSEPVRIYLANLTEFDLINSFHLHADFFRYYPTGTSDQFEYTDTVMQCQGQRGIIEIEFPHTGHVHVPRPPVGVHRARLDGLLRGRRLMEAGAAPPAGLAWRLWALVPILLLALVVGAFVSAGTRSSTWSAATRRRRTSSTSAGSSSTPGEIRIRVRNPQPEDLTIAAVTVDDAIVPFTVDGPATLGRLRSSTIVVAVRLGRGRPERGRRDELDRHRDGRRRRRGGRDAAASARGFFGYALIGSWSGVVPVALGMLWLPSLRRADPKWLAAFMALTGGLLTFLARRGAGGGVRAAGALPGCARRAGARAARRRPELPRGDVLVEPPRARAGRAGRARRWRCWSRSASASTTSARGSRSGRRSPSASSRSAPS